MTLFLFKLHITTHKHAPKEATKENPQRDTRVRP
uniref:Uncharacterized protein n=1 Tax=Arundo donax TaxID=35708 RepID=A0A0A8Z8Z7_ARUDO